MNEGIWEELNNCGTTAHTCIAVRAEGIGREERGEERETQPDRQETGGEYLFPRSPRLLRFSLLGETTDTNCAMD